MILVVILSFLFELLIIACSSPGVDYWITAAILLHIGLLFAKAIPPLLRYVVGAVVVYSFFAPNPVMLVVFTLMVSITTGVIYAMASGDEGHDSVTIIRRHR